MKANRPSGMLRELVDAFMKPGAETRDLVVKAVCGGFCEYFNGKGGEPECAGFRVVEAAVEAGRLDPSHFEHLVGKGLGDPLRAGCLINNMCTACGYLADGCDFMSTSPPPGATPCGGYRIIQRLLETRALTQDQSRGIVEAGVKSRIQDPGS